MSLIPYDELPIDLNTFDAKQARERSQNIVSETAKEQLQIVLKKILNETNNGGLYCYHYDNLQPSVINELKKRGFDIKSTSDPRDGITYSIKW